MNKSILKKISVIFILIMLIQIMYFSYLFIGTYDIFVFIAIELATFIVYQIKSNKQIFILSCITILIATSLMMVLQPRYNKFEIWNVMEKELKMRNATEISALGCVYKNNPSLLYKKGYYCRATDGSGKIIDIYGNPEDGTVSVHVK